MKTCATSASCLVAISILSVVCPAFADPVSTNNPQLQTWTSSDRYAFVGCLVIGLGSGIGGMGAYFEAQDKYEKANEFERNVMATSGKAKPCPGESSCQEIAKQREDAQRSERGGIAGMVIGGLFIGVLLPVVVYYGFQPKEPSTPNLMMKLGPSFSPGQAGLVMTGRF